ncbi:hypothetical protein ACFE04_029308 [Oxalis oulophora]
MGCVSSKHLEKQLREERTIITNNNGITHVVSLTSSTYGALNLDNSEQRQRQQPVKEILKSSPPREDPEIINTWELMEDLEEGMPVITNRKSPKSSLFLRGFGDVDGRSPLKFLNQIASPRKVKKSSGKENKNISPKPPFTPGNRSVQTPSKAVLRLSFPVKSTKLENLDCDSAKSSRRMSFSPMFDPKLVAAYEKEISEEKEQIKRVILPSPNGKFIRDSESMLRNYEEKCPIGGDNAVVIYTTTLRGIRKTFEDCNTVRSIVESHLIRVLERDISMDSGFKEELRGLMGTKEVKVPVLFVKGRFIGGVDEVVKLEEEGKLGVLFRGIPVAVGGGCKGCGGVRFVMCRMCNGSCKVLGEEKKKMVKCDECNENGLIQCPVCCLTS